MIQEFRLPSNWTQEDYNAFVTQGWASGLEDPDWNWTPDDQPDLHVPADTPMYSIPETEEADHYENYEYIDADLEHEEDEWLDFWDERKGQF